MAIGSYNRAGALTLAAEAAAHGKACNAALKRCATQKQNPNQEQSPLFDRSSERSKRGIQLAVVLLAIFVFLGAGDEEARFAALGHKLMCVCGCNQVLLECNHVGCRYSDRMRDELAAALGRADSDDLVLQSFVQKYGPTVLLAPTATGFNRLAWVMPYLALVFGLITVVLIVRAWKMRPLAVAGGGTVPATAAELEHFRDQARRETEL
jgi:cytochrome c-type biogenesis protein CcmH